MMSTLFCRFPHSVYTSQARSAPRLVLHEVDARSFPGIARANSASLTVLKDRAARDRKRFGSVRASVSVVCRANACPSRPHGVLHAHRSRSFLSTTVQTALHLQRNHVVSSGKVLSRYAHRRVMKWPARGASGHGIPRDQLSAESAGALP